MQLRQLWMRCMSEAQCAERFMASISSGFKLLGTLACTVCGYFWGRAGNTLRDPSTALLDPWYAGPGCVGSPGCMSGARRSCRGLEGRGSSTARAHTRDDPERAGPGVRPQRDARRAQGIIQCGEWHDRRQSQQHNHAPALLGHRGVHRLPDRVAGSERLQPLPQQQPGGPDTPTAARSQACYEADSGGRE